MTGLLTPGSAFSFSALACERNMPHRAPRFSPCTQSLSARKRGGGASPAALRPSHGLYFFLFLLLLLVPEPCRATEPRLPELAVREERRGRRRVFSKPRGHARRRRAHQLLRGRRVPVASRLRRRRAPRHAVPRRAPAGANVPAPRAPGQGRRGDRGDLWRREGGPGVDEPAAFKGRRREVSDVDQHRGAKYVEAECTKNVCVLSGMYSIWVVVASPQHAFPTIVLGRGLSMLHEVTPPDEKDRPPVPEG